MAGSFTESTIFPVMKPVELPVHLQKYSAGCAAKGLHPRQGLLGNLIQTAPVQYANTACGKRLDQPGFL